MRIWDLLILIAYFVMLTAVMSKIINSFNDEYTVQLDEGELKQQLVEAKLDEMVEISFKFDKRYEFGKDDKLKQLSISVKNKSKNHSIYVDWDYCAMTDLDGRSRRVTRLAPGTTLDLFQEQVFSTIVPGTTLKENVTAEDVLKRKEPKDDKNVALEMEISKPLLDLMGLSKGGDGAKKKFYRFKASMINLDFAFDLSLRVIGSSRPSSDRHLIHCKFILRKLPWQAGLPWNPK